MIKINLLPVREWRRREQVRLQITIFVLSVIFLISCLASASIFLKGQVYSKRQQKEKLEAKKKELDIVEKTIAQLKAKAEEVEGKFNTVEGLQKERTLLIEALDAIVSVIPEEKMWFEKLTLKGGSLQLSGIALDNQTIAAFMKKMEGLSAVKSVGLNSIKRTIYDVSVDKKGNAKAGGYELMEFSLAISIGPTVKNVAKVERPAASSPQPPKKDTDQKKGI